MITAGDWMHYTVVFSAMCLKMYLSVGTDCRRESHFIGLVGVGWREVMQMPYSSVHLGQK